MPTNTRVGLGCTFTVRGLSWDYGKGTVVAIMPMYCKAIVDYYGERWHISLADLEVL